MVIHHRIVCLLIIVVIASGQKWIQYTSQAQQLMIIGKYLNRIRNGYFVDCGANNPIHMSNTIKLSNWKGVIIEADPEKASNIRDFEPTGVTALNFGLTNVSGTKTSFYENDSKYKPIKDAMTINLADLCHKYYKAKPTLMNIDLEGLGASVLQSNDWSNNKCVPDIIHSKDLDSKNPSDQVNIENFLKNNSYILQQKNSKSNIFIHKTKLEFYQNEAKINSQYLKNVTMAVNWQGFAAILTKLLGKPFLSQYAPSTHPAYIFTRQPSIINIEQLNKYSNFISQAGLNRPIILLEYDYTRSSIYLGTKVYNIQEVTIDKLCFKKISSKTEGKELLIFVVDHEKNNGFNLQVMDDAGQASILQIKTDGLIDLMENRKDTIKDLMLENSDNFQTSISYLLILVIVLTNSTLFCLYSLYNKKFASSRGQNQRRSDRKSNSEANISRKI